MTTRKNTPEVIDSVALCHAANLGLAMRPEENLETLRVYGIWFAEIGHNIRAFLRCGIRKDGVIAKVVVDAVEAVEATRELILIVYSRPQVLDLQLRTQHSNGGRFIRFQAACRLTQVLRPWVRITSPDLMKNLGLRPVAGDVKVNLAIAEEVRRTR